MVEIYLVFPWKLFDLAFSLFVQCSMQVQANVRLFIVLSPVWRFLSNYLPTGSGKSLIFQMALVHR